MVVFAIVFLRFSWFSINKVKGGSMDIGLLEDDAAIQEMLRLVLEDEGYAVTIYPTADACLNALLVLPTEQKNKPVDLLIVDWRLSGSVTGTEVIHKLRSNSSFGSLPIILTTAATFHDTNELQNLHVSLLQKPFALDDVVALIKNLVHPGSTTVD
jgi:two-component system, chemotaxis family, chemotaxis protein CheY